MSDTTYLGIEVNSSSLKRGERDLDKFGKTGVAAGDKIDSFTNRSVNNFRKVAGGIAVIVAAFAAFSFGARTIADFESSVSKMGAVSRATTVELAAMRDVAKDLGITTEFSATQAADGLTFLAKAGFSAKESMAAIPSVLNLATAAQLDLGTAADITSNIMSAFSVGADKSSDVADLMAAASSRANTNVGQLGDAMKFAGPVAASLGISMADTAAAIGILSDAGIQGGMAGTGLRRVWASLLAPGKAAKDVIKNLGIELEDINPQTNEFSDIIKKLAGGGLSAADAVTVFGRQGLSAISALTSKYPELRELTDQFIDIADESKRMAEAFRDNLEGDFKSFGSAVQGSILSLGEAGFTGALRYSTQALTSLFRGLSSVIDHIEDFRGYTIAAATALTVAYYPAILGAITHTYTWIAALFTLRGALIATGVGALVVAAGFLINQFLKLSEASGGFGVAMGLVKDVVVEVFQRIGDGATYVNESINVMNAKMSAAFYRALRTMAGAFVDFTWTVADGINSLFNTNLSGVSATITQELALSEKAAEKYGTASEAAAGKAKAAFTAPLESLAAIRAAIAVANEEISAADAAAAEIDKTLNNAARTVGKTEKELTAAAKAAEALADEIERLEFDANPLKKYNAEMVKLNKIYKTGKLSGSAYANAVDDLNAGLVDSTPIVGDVADAFTDFIVGGLRDFKSFAKSILDSFKNMLSEMIATALRNKIFIPIITGGVGAGGAAAASGAGSAVGSGLSGGIGSALGGTAIGGALSTVGSSLAAGFMTSVYGGIGGLTGAVSGGLATGGIAGISTAIGAVAAPLLAIVAAFSFFKKKTKTLDEGIRITVDGLTTAVNKFETIQTKRFWGLSKKVKTHQTDLPLSESGPAENQLNNLLSVIAAMAAELGIGANAFDRFTSQISVSTHKLSEDEAKEAVAKAFADVADSFAGLIPGLQALRKDGEGSVAALNRVTTSLATVNDVFKSLLFPMQEISLAGAAASASFVDLFGTLDNFVASSSAYYENFYTADEKIANATARITESLAALGINFLPKDRAGYRGLVDTASVAGDHDLAASLIQLSPAFAALITSVDTLDATLQMQVAERNYATGIDYARGLARASNNIEYTAQDSSAELLAELKALNARIDTMQSTAEITAASAGATAELTEGLLDNSDLARMNP